MPPINKRSDTTYRNICFTLNNYTEQDINNMSQLENIRYIIYGREIAPTTNTPHLQGYLELNSSQRLSYIKKLLKNNTIHIENRMGTQLQAITYCKKDNNYTEHGIPKREKETSKQGSRTDITDIWTAIKTGSSKTELLELYPIQYAKYSKAIADYYTINEPSRDRNNPIQIIWHYGPTGTNKTRTVYEQDEDVFVPKNFKWWDGYDRHKTVLLDDFRADYCKFHELLTLLDRYQYKVEVKGGMRQLVATKIYITSPYHPDDLYRNKTTEDIQQLTRRITQIIHFKSSKETTIVDTDDTASIHSDNTI